MVSITPDVLPSIGSSVDNVDHEEPILREQKHDHDQPSHENTNYGKPRQATKVVIETHNHILGSCCLIILMLLDSEFGLYIHARTSLITGPD